jgi:hypothetical protein
MAHIKTFQISVAFEFKPLRRRWVECRAKAAGWGTGHGDFQYGSFVVQDGPKAGATFDLDIRGAAIPRRIHDSIFEAEALPDSEELADLLSDVEIPCFAPVLEKRDLSRMTVAHLESVRAKLDSADPWEMRADFFRCKPTSQSFFDFLGRWGDWDTGGSVVAVSQLLESQLEFREAVKGRPEDWFRFSYLILQSQRTAPHFRLAFAGCREAIRTTITIDLLNRVSFGVCAREDCKAPFPITSEHAKIYCGHKCAHLVSVRKQRLAMKKEKRVK